MTVNEGDSLLHVVAACGDGGDGSEDFLDCAKMIYEGRSSLLVARNNRGDTRPFTAPPELGTPA